TTLPSGSSTARKSECRRSASSAHTTSQWSSVGGTARGPPPPHPANALTSAPASATAATTCRHRPPDMARFSTIRSALCPTSPAPFARALRVSAPDDRCRRVEDGARRLLALLGLAVVFEGYGRSLPGVALAHIGNDLGAGSSALSFALALIASGALGVIVLGWLADRFGRRTLLLVSVAGYAVLGAATASVG